MTVHTQIWSECTQCGWSQGIDIHIIKADLDIVEAALPVLTVEAYLGEGRKISQVSTLVTKHECPKSHDACRIPREGGCQHGSLDCPAAKVPAVYESSPPILYMPF